MFRSMRGERRYLAHETVCQWRLIVDENALRSYALDALIEGGKVHAGAQQLLFAPSSASIAHGVDHLAQYGRALTIPYLCAAVGTNEFALKQGFREVFGVSPHKMLVDIRMRKAQALLESGEPVSSVAYKVGFQHPSSFSAAFRRYFGCVPKSLK